MPNDERASTPTLSKYKWKRLATQALINALRLHADSILLYDAGSYPSAYQLSVLALEEFSKAKWIEDYYYSAITNSGFADATTEQSWLRLLYVHSKKQYGFIARDVFDYPPALVTFIESGRLDLRKQQATYVGLNRKNKDIRVQERISLPSSISSREAKRLISWVNAEFIFVHEQLLRQEGYFGIEEMDEVILSDNADIIFKWPFKSRIRSRRNRKLHLP